MNYYNIIKKIFKNELLEKMNMNKQSNNMRKIKIKNWIAKNKFQNKSNNLKNQKKIKKKKTICRT